MRAVAVTGTSASTTGATAAAAGKGAVQRSVQALIVQRVFPAETTTVATALPMKLVSERHSLMKRLRQNQRHAGHRHFRHHSQVAAR